MTTTDQIKAAVERTLEQHRSQIDAEAAPRTVTLVVRLMNRHGRMAVVIYRPEYSDEE